MKTFKAENFKSLEDSFFETCSFINCHFSESILRNAKFCSCSFISSNLSMPKLDGCRFQDVQFVDCKIVGVDFFKCEKSFFSPSFKNCLLQYCNFSDLNMKNISFTGSKLHESHFSHTILNGADFTEVDLLRTVFHNCDLSHANFSSAKNYDIDPRVNKMKKAKFSLPEAVGLLRGFEIIIV